MELMARMAKTIDGFTQHQTRLAVVIDGLDSCEQDKVLQMLDTVRRSHGFIQSVFLKITEQKHGHSLTSSSSLTQTLAVTSQP